MHLFFFPRFLHLQPHIYRPQLDFSVFFIENTVPQNLNTTIIVNVLLSTNSVKIDFYALMDNRNLRSSHILYMYVLSKISHTFKSNQAPSGF